jgi:hypothetical protein
MEHNKYNQLKAAIQRRAESLKTPPKDNETNKRQMDDAIKSLRKKRKKLVSEYLVAEGFTNTRNEAEIVVNLMSDHWFEATEATKALVRGLKVQGAAQKQLAHEDRRAEAKRRAEERSAQLERERRYAEERRENPDLLRREAQKRTLPTRMERAAKRLGFE